VSRTQVTGGRHIHLVSGISIEPQAVPLPRNLQLIVKSDGTFESGLDTTSIARPSWTARKEKQYP
jgi:hypothetical protein